MTLTSASCLTLLRDRIGGLIFGGAYTWRGLFSEFYGILRFSTYRTLLCKFLSRLTFISEHHREPIGQQRSVNYLQLSNRARVEQAPDHASLQFSRRVYQQLFVWLSLNTSH